MKIIKSALFTASLLVSWSAFASVDLPPANCPSVTPVIDGRFGIGEWDGATYDKFDVRTPDGNLVVGAMFVQNDAKNLYVAIRFPRAAVDDFHAVTLRIDGDDSGGVPNPNDDSIGLFDDRLSNQHVAFDESAYIGGGCPELFGACFLSDRSFGGRIDTHYAVGNDGDATIIELVHPLASGEGQDLNARLGGTIGFNLFLRVATNGIGFGDTSYPSSSASDWARYPVTVCR